MARADDLVIVGLGPAGLTAARLASRELGLRVAAVDRGRIGGTNVWSGSIPSKALLEATVRHRQLAAPDPATAWGAMVEARESVHAHVSDEASVNDVRRQHHDSRRPIPPHRDRKHTNRSFYSWHRRCSISHQ